uniref:MIT_C domain-containing protein n=1 Tax=Strongyloides venezuelensis TaxID=75913 RepID=A0A0K0F5Y7_STRVS
MSCKRGAFKFKLLHSFESQEEELSNELEVQKKRLESINELESESALKIAREVESNLKRLFGDSKNFRNVRSKIGRCLTNDVQPTITRLVNGNNLGRETVNNLGTSNGKDVDSKPWRLEFVEIIQIRENETGFPFEKIFTKERVGPEVTQILIEDPYLVTRQQVMVLYIFILAMKHTFSNLEYVEVKTKSNPGRTDVYRDLSRKFPELDGSQLIIREFETINVNLNYVKDKCKGRGVRFHFGFGNSSMHERRIFFNSGVVAHPGRGLSIYRIDYFNPGRAFNDVPCKECNIPIFRLKDWNTEVHTLADFN